MSSNDASVSVTDRLLALEASLRLRLADRADVDRSQLNDHIAVITLLPHRHTALTVEWLDIAGNQLQINAGYIGGVWELDREHSDVDFLESIIEAVIAGRVVETFGHRRSRVEVTLADGRVEQETGTSGCLNALIPRLGWTHRGRQVTYDAY